LTDCIFEKKKRLIIFKTQTDGCCKPWNLNNFAAVSHGILQTGPRNLAKFAAENCGR